MGIWMELLPIGVKVGFDGRKGTIQWGDPNDHDIFDLFLGIHITPAESQFGLGVVLELIDLHLPLPADLPIFRDLDGLGLQVNGVALGMVLNSRQ